MVRLSGAGLPGLKEIEEAESRIRPHVPQTPLEHSRGISELLGREVHLKLETFHPIRVFKIRGAVNKLLTLDQGSLRRGVITASSGNHGFAVAYASRLFGVSSTICVPQNVNPSKLRAIEEQGAEVVRFGSGYDETAENAASLSRKRELTLIHAFNDPVIIAGQGTCGLEISRQLPDLDTAVVAIGGGGLISGVAIALKASLEKVTVLGAETTAIPSMLESIRAGRPTRVVPKPTIADGMQASIPGTLTLEAVMKHVAKVGLVDDAEIRDAMYDLLSRARVLAEPAGAAPLAAMKGSLRGEGGSKLVLVVSGGNVSLSLLSSILKEKESQQ
ncbi:MAG: threonine/serine dehydratase [archaeon]|nr:MAG: threonine/serine dehydratase [archaeon]